MWGLVILTLFAIVGAALIGGGIVTYRGSTTLSVRAGGAAATAAGFVMWALILFVILFLVPVSVTQGS